MPRLEIQINYTNNLSEGSLSWLEESIPPILSPFGLTTRVFIADNALMAPTSMFDDGDLFNFTDGLIKNSPIRQQAENNGRWFIHVLITSFHINKLLGIMYDFQFDPQYRQGCAVFASQIKHSISTNAEGTRRVLLRTIVHEVGHCLNLEHQFDATLMAQTNNVAALLGQNWISNFNFRFSQEDIDFVTNFPSSSKPGGSSSRVGRIADKILTNYKDLRVSAKVLMNNSKNILDFGDAVTIQVKITNLGCQTINIPSTVSWNAQHCRIWLKIPRAKYRLLQDSIHRCGVDPDYISIAVNEQRFFTLSLFADNKGYLFNTPGLHKVKIAVINTDGRISKAREISFVISKPTVDIKPYKTMINSPQILKYIILKQNTEDVFQEALEKTKAENPNTGFLRVLLWADFYKLKKKIHFIKDSKAKKELMQELWNICNQLYDIETSSIRKGKMVHELVQIAKKIKTDSFDLNKYQIKQMKAYQNFATYSIKRTKPKLKIPNLRGKIILFIAVLSMVFSSCIKNKIKYQENTQIYGSAQYNDPVKGNMGLPTNQTVNVVIDDSQNPFSTFKTNELGRYTFSPFRKGQYALEFSYTDTLLQYDASLVRPQDIDTLKKSAFGIVRYAGKTKTFAVDGSNKAYKEDIVLQSSETALKLLFTDDQNRPLSGVRVCLYTSQSIAQQNIPYCGGAFAYLSSDINGYVLFTGLHVQPYYFNARGDFGVVQLTNQWSNTMKIAQVAKDGEITEKQIILK